MHRRAPCRVHAARPMRSDHEIAFFSRCPSQHDADQRDEGEFQTEELQRSSAPCLLTATSSGS